MISGRYRLLPVAVKEQYVVNRNDLSKRFPETYNSSPDVTVGVLHSEVLLSHSVALFTQSAPFSRVLSISLVSKCESNAF